MKVCYYGIYDKTCLRNQVIIKGLRRNGVEVFECNSPLRKFDITFTNKWAYIRYHLRMAFEKYRSYLLLILKYLWMSKNFNFLFVGHPYDYDVIIAYCLSRLTKKRLIFDAFVSNYDTAVIDRRAINKKSIQARKLWLIDKISLELSDGILTDTLENSNYYRKEFGLHHKTFIEVEPGADDEVFYPSDRGSTSSDKFTVLFYGSYTPLHGIEYIVQAAKLLENEIDIVFELVGHGQTYDSIFALSHQLNTGNVYFYECVPPDAIRDYIIKSDIGLGIFGSTEKAKRVIPFKLYDLMAMRKPVITGDSSVARRLLKDRYNCILCQMANPQSLAEAIRLLRRDESLRKKIANNGYDLYKAEFCPEKIGKKMITCLESVEKTSSWNSR